MIVALILAQAMGFNSAPGVNVQAGGVAQGRARTLNCTGAASCSVAAGVATINVTAGTGGGASSAGVLGNIQTSDGAGGFATYAGGTCGYAIQSLDGSGVPTCLAAPVAGVDFAPATSGTAILKGNGAGGFTNAAAGSDYQAPLTFPLSTANGGTGSANGAATKLCGARLSVAAQTTGAISCTAAEIFFCIYNIAGYSGGGDIASFRFNGDSTAGNYQARWMVFSNATTPVLSAVNFTTGGNIQLGPTAITLGRSGMIKCSNFTSIRKVCRIEEAEESSSQATLPQLGLAHGEWFNTSSQITSIEMRTNGGSVTMAAGSSFICYGGTGP